MLRDKRFIFLLSGLLLLALAACQPETQTVEVEVTRVITETVTEVVEGEPQVVEVTRVVEVPAEVEQVEEPPQSKDLIICMSQEPDTLYIYGGSSLVGTAVQHAIYENDFTTLSYAFQAQGLEKLPSLADGDAYIEEVEVSEGDVVIVAGAPTPLEVGMTITNSDGEAVEFDGTPVTMAQLNAEFTLKERIWSDGTPVTSADSVFSYEVAAHPDTPTSKFATDRTANYEALDDMSVRWTGVPGFLDSQYYSRFWAPLPQHQLSEYTPVELVDAEETNRLPMGDGPFVIEEWRPGESIYLTKNTNYYRADEGLPYLDSVTYKFVPDTNTMMAQVISGECDIGTQDGLNVSQSPFLKEAEQSGLIDAYFQTGTVYEHIDFGINSYGDYGDDIGRPDWFEDVRVRQAMTMCTDRQSMVDNILYGESEVIHTYIPRVHPLYPDNVEEWPYDVEAANALLDDVGFADSDGDGIREYTDGTPFKVTLGTTTGNEMRAQLTQIFKENMLQCGIDIELYYQPASEWFANGPDGVLFGRRFDLGEFAWLTGVDPSCNLYTSEQIPGPPEETNPFTGRPYGGWGGSNETGWSNPEYDVICNTALNSLPGTPEFENNHKEAQRIFAQEVPVIPLFLRLKVAATRPSVLNFGVDPTQNSEVWNIFEIDLEQ